jgi:hypothetical protein
VLAEGVDRKFHHATIRPVDFLLLEIDGDRRIRAAAGIVQQLVDVARKVRLNDTEIPQTAGA